MAVRVLNNDGCWCCGSQPIEDKESLVRGRGVDEFVIGVSRLHVVVMTVIIVVVVIVMMIVMMMMTGSATERSEGNRRLEVFLEPEHALRPSHQLLAAEHL